MRFELDRLTEYTNEAMLDEIGRVTGLVHGPTLPRSQFDKHAKVSSSAVQRRFHGWGKGLTAAGLGHLYRGPAVTRKMRRQAARKMTNDDVLAELRRVARKVGTETLTQEQLEAHSPIATVVIKRRFGSWDNALKEAGLRLTRFGRRYSEEQYFENLLTVWTYYGRQPRYSEMDKPPSVITAGAYEHRFGKWTNALVAFVQRANEPSDAAESDTSRTPTGPAAHLAPRDQKTSDGKASAEGPKRKLSISLRYAILKRDGFRCVLCGCSPATDLDCELHVDHVIPDSKGGPTAAENLRTTCSLCNIGKGDHLE
jgi:hypothetical protein